MWSSVFFKVFTYPQKIGPKNFAALTGGIFSTNLLYRCVLFSILLFSPQAGKFVTIDHRFAMYLLFETHFRDQNRTQKLHELIKISKKNEILSYFAFLHLISGYLKI
jgi:hypothetical protein